MSNDLVNHVALILDASSSMAGLTDAVVRVADEQVKHLAEVSKSRDQETRISIVTFSDPHRISWPVWDKDVLRMPSIRGLYRADGNTALIDATLEGIRDLSEVPTKHGDHAFLFYVITDGQENRSYAVPNDLRSAIDQRAARWTFAALVPNLHGVEYAVNYGFPRGNVAVWETTAEGLAFAGAAVTAATESYFGARAVGARTSTNLFTPDVSGVTAKEVIRTLRRLNPADYQIHECAEGAHEIADFVEARTGRPYVLGSTFYKLVKREEIQPQKEVILVHKTTGTAHHGAETRALLKLPNHTVKVNPADAPDYDIYVQSTSVNRKVRAGDRVLVRNLTASVVRR